LFHDTQTHTDRDRQTEKQTEDLVIEETIEQRDVESLERDEKLSEVRPDGETEPRASWWVDD